MISVVQLFTSFGDCMATDFCINFEFKVTLTDFKLFLKILLDCGLDEYSIRTDEMSERLCRVN